MNCEGSTLKNEIAECEFLLADLNMYLDTHPEDMRALSDYNCYCQQLRRLKDRFIMECGPLENFGNSMSEGSWKWNDAPWPWE